MIDGEQRRTVMEISTERNATKVLFSPSDFIFKGLQASILHNS